MLLAMFGGFYEIRGEFRSWDIENVLYLLQIHSKILLNTVR